MPGRCRPLRATICRGRSAAFPAKGWGRAVRARRSIFPVGGGLSVVSHQRENVPVSAGELGSCQWACSTFIRQVYWFLGGMSKWKGWVWGCPHRCVQKQFFQSVDGVDIAVEASVAQWVAVQGDEEGVVQRYSHSVHLVRILIQVFHPNRTCNQTSSMVYSSSIITSHIVIVLSLQIFVNFAQISDNQSVAGTVDVDGIFGGFWGRRLNSRLLRVIVHQSLM